MSDEADKITTSYAYQKRGELPSQTSDFYSDAGLSREEFEISRAAQIVPDTTPARFANRDGSGGGMAKTYRHELPDPRPNFAPPNRRLYEEDWFQKIRCPQNKAQPAKTKDVKNIRDP